MHHQLTTFMLTQLFIFSQCSFSFWGPPEWNFARRKHRLLSLIVQDLKIQFLNNRFSKRLRGKLIQYSVLIILMILNKNKMKAFLILLYLQKVNIRIFMAIISRMIYLRPLISVPNAIVREIVKCTTVWLKPFSIRRATTRNRIQTALGL